MRILSRVLEFLKRSRVRPLSEWYSVACDDEGVTLDVRPRWKRATTASFHWKDVVRVCFEARDYLQSDCVYVFTSGRAESYVIPLDAKGGKEFWGQVLDRKLFDAELAIVAAGAAVGLFCWPPPEVRVGADEGAELF